MPDPEKVAEHIRETAQAEILPRFRLLRREDIREKGPGDFVTLADLEAERQLTLRLGALLPGSVVLGEEAAAQDRGRFALLAGEAPVWVIDPVDGTANFARGQPGFAVIVALIEALAASGRVGAVRNRGCSGLEYLDIALARAHYSLHSRSLPWDHAAGMLITAEAGGVAAFLDGSPYDPRITDRPVLAAASAAGWGTVREVVGALA